MFLEAISCSHGCMLNYSNIARECDVERRTVENYVSILIDLLLAFEIPVFSKRAKRKNVRHTKLYLFDAGVFCSLRPNGPLDRPEEIGGPALEGLVAQHLRAWIDYGAQDSQLYFWRTLSGVEVDFIIYGPNDFWAIEVKNSKDVRPKDLRPLKTFHEDYPECKPVLLCRGNQRLLKDEILCLPCEEFFQNLQPESELIAGHGQT